ncbi:innate immunity activator protein [Rana temporaria]|uniref:innate immunity activator protein n=1 Tax=Rana temporaria TaxID=8407 RepID=UPI001AAD886B|nr:innate immunity activator protein [Rana temporaria]
MGIQEDPNDREMDYIIQPVTSSPLTSCKELTQAMRIQQSSLEKKMQSCLDELRQICLREAELIGVLPKEFPLKPGETPPKVRRRVGALFKLDERTIHCHGKDPLGYLERDLALQRQITEAARRLYMEESVSRQVRQQRKAALKTSEQKLRFLENRLVQEQSQENLHTDDSSSTSESSSLSDVATLGEDDSLQRVQVNRPMRPQTLEGLCLMRTENENDKSPIQNSPWMESSLDLPYDKNQRRSCNSQGNSRWLHTEFIQRGNSSPAVTPVSEESFTESVNNLNLAHLGLQDSPERSNKRLASYSVRVQSVPGDSDIRGRTICRRATSFNNSQNNNLSTLSLSNPVYISSNPLYTSNSSESLLESSSPQPSYNLAYCPLTPKSNVLLVTRAPSIREHSVIYGPSKSEVTDELRGWHARARMRGSDAIRPRSLDRKGAVRIRRGISWSPALGSQKTQIAPFHVLRRTAEGAPLQWYDPEEAQIISQV